MTKVVNLCDICGRDIVDVKIKYTAKRKRMLLFPYETWDDIDLCEDCLSKIIKVKASKAEALTHTIKALEKQTGHWLKDRGSIYRCSNCGNFLDFDGVNAGRGDANYCPNCGVRMGGRNECETEGEKV